MRYQETLLEQWKIRQKINPSFSLRSFARLVGLSPSKLSEILNLKKGVSLSRAKTLCDKLHLGTQDEQIFLLSVQSQHARRESDRKKAKKDLQDISRRLRERPPLKSAQRNAWYFGAVARLFQSGLKSEAEIAKKLKLTKLQVENALRFFTRIQKLHPKVQKINFEPVSVFNKMQKQFIEQGDDFILETEFTPLTAKQIDELRLWFHKATQQNSKDSNEIYMINFSISKLYKGENNA